VIVRPVGNYDLPEWLRVTVGLPDENTAFLHALSQALAQAGPDAAAAGAAASSASGAGTAGRAAA